MSILIKGMEIPKDYFEEFVIYADGTVEDAGRFHVGTAIPVPEPHGRLIDADALVEFIENFYSVTWSGGYAGGRKDTCVAILKEIERLPTIIEAEV